MCGVSVRYIIKSIYRTVERMKKVSLPSAEAVLPANFFFLRKKQIIRKSKKIKKQKTKKS